jgi:hypothetical protein
MQKNHVAFMMHNSAHNLVLEAFSGDKYQIFEIICARRINCKNPASTASELIIIPSWEVG